MNARVVVLVVALAPALLGCSQEEPGSALAPAPTPAPAESVPATVSSAPPGTPAPVATPAFEPARVLIDTDDGSVLIDAEKAETPEQRSFGLMFRRELDPDAGMVFLFFEEHGGAFYMKNTLIPLSIAFFTEDGHILDILDMQPCERDPCELYYPTLDGTNPIPYWGALEVNQGAFEEWGVEVGDRITVTH
ncbi:MAG TPA: DUF192 domain-containing protein [Actinomycetota bacterium]|nr:DUF192 domain-containing protein [Actinomycetota bacterium]